MVDSTAKSEEALITVRDVRFNLLRRHPRIERRNDDNRDIDFWKEIDGHTHDGRDADDHHKETHHQDEEGILDSEGGHY